MITKKVLVTQEIEVTVDETKFSEKFMQEFRDSFYQFDDLDAHIKHLAQLEARGFVPFDNSFIEGYGWSKDMGISFKNEGIEEEILGS